MRARGYELFALVAWPAAIWGVVELGLRAASGSLAGVFDTAALTVCAFGTIAAARWRRRALAEADVREG